MSTRRCSTASSAKTFEIFTRNVDQLIPSLEKVIGRLVHLQCTQLAGQVWQTHWEKVSHDGFDIVKGKSVDYGNIEYVVVLNLITSRSPYILKCMTWLGDSHFGSLNPDVVLTSHNVEMKADVIEVCLAAFRGHPDFAHLAPDADLPGLHLQLYGRWGAAEDNGR